MKDKYLKAITHLVNNIKDVGFYPKETKVIKNIVNKVVTLPKIKKINR